MKGMVGLYAEVLGQLLVAVLCEGIASCEEILRYLLYACQFAASMQTQLAFQGIISLSFIYIIIQTGIIEILFDDTIVYISDLTGTETSSLRITSFAPA